MKRLQIMIEEDLDAELGRMARKEGRSKASIIRELVRSRVRPLPPIEDDPITKLMGSLKGDGEHVHHDDVIYSRETIFGE